MSIRWTMGIWALGRLSVGSNSGPHHPTIWLLWWKQQFASQQRPTTSVSQDHFVLRASSSLYGELLLVRSNDRPDDGSLDLPRYLSCPVEPFLLRQCRYQVGSKCIIWLYSSYVVMIFCIKDTEIFINLSPSSWISMDLGSSSSLTNSPLYLH